MFQGLSTALTALYANQQALETTGNNIANANTEGYSRQSVVMEPNGGAAMTSFWSTPSRVGTGVNVQDIVRLRDAFLDSRSLTEHGTQGELTRMKSTFDTVELSFREPSDTGLNQQLADFWASWDDVTDPTDQSTRSSVVESARTLVTGLQQASSDLTELHETSMQSLKNDVKQLNAWAQNVADLNLAIQAAKQAGASPNSLLDQRDLLVSKMSDLGGVTVKETQNGSIAVRVGGVAIVRDDRVRMLQVDDTGATPIMRWDADGDADTVTDGVQAIVSGGDINGLLNSINTTIPRYRSLLDSVATNLISTVNTQHALGLDANGNAGGTFFTGTSAATIDVRAALVADTSLLAATAAGGGAKDAENARAMANLATAVNGPDSEYRNLINTLGVEAQRANNQADIQESIVQSVDNSRNSVSGVSLDEEMTNMIRFQKAYTATAKYLSVMDEVLSSLLGLVR